MHFYSYYFSDQIIFLFFQSGVLRLQKLSVTLALTATVFSMVLFAAPKQTLAAEIKQPTGVVELFTSQGCYSCPPADELVGKFAKTNEVLALSWHVNYWDYLGWKDSFASDANTRRQYDYAKSLQERQVYTPQAVINGREHVVGSDEAKLNGTLKSLERDGKGMIVPINASVDGKSIRINIDHSKEADEATLLMIFFNKAHEVKIKRGENGGKTLTYHNVVHDSQTLGMVKQNGLQLDFSIMQMKKRGFDGTALILQKMDENGNPSAIIGATVITDL